MPTTTARGSRIAPSLAVLGAVIVTALLVTIPAGIVARKFEDDRRYLKNFRTPFDSEAFYTFSADYALDSSERNDVVFIGGSTCLCGIQVEQFQELTGLSAHNLGSIGTIGYKGFNLLLEFYLEHHPAPRLVVFCVHPRELGPPRAPKRQLKEEVLARYSTAAERFLWCYGAAHNYPRPSHMDPVRYYVSQGLLMTLGELRGGERYYLNQPTHGLFDFSYNELRARVCADRGFYSLGGTNTLSPLPPDDPSAGALLPADGASVGELYPVLPEFDDGVRRMARIAAEKGVRLMIRLSPDLIGTDPDRCGAIRDWFEQLESDCPNVVCDRPTILLDGPDFFADDLGHVNLRGAERFTNLVAAKVMQTLETAESTDSGTERTKTIAHGQAD